MAVDTSKDPIFQTFQGIWDCLDAKVSTALVKANNRIKHTKDQRTVDKSGLNTSDLPQMRVVQTGLKGQIFSTSSSCTINVYWAIEVKVGDKRLEKLTAIQFAIYCAMSQWETYIRDEVTWGGGNPFRRLLPMKVETEYATRPKKPDPAGWITVWAGVGDLFLSTTAIQAYPD